MNSNPLRRAVLLLLGCLVTAAGLIILKHSNIVTGGTAGLSLYLSYIIPVPFYSLFLLINIPFLFFSYFKMGRPFTLRTIIAIVLLTGMTSVDRVLPHFSIPPIVGALAGGAVVGVGICSLFRIGASLGGSTILALYLQKKFRLDPGKTNFVFDCMIVLASFSAISLDRGLISTLSIAVTSMMISIYKKRMLSAKKAEPSKPDKAAAA